MCLRAGVFSLGLPLLSRVFGLLRESAQAAAFGTTGMGDAVMVMFTLPDLLVGILVSRVLWAALSSGWLLMFPLVARSLASSAARGTHCGRVRCARVCFDLHRHGR